MVQFVLNALPFLFGHTAGVEREGSMQHVSLGERLKKITTSRQKAISSSQSVVILI